MGFQDYIGVDNKDLFKINANELRKLNLDYISTSAAANPIFDMKILYLALKVGIPNVLMPKKSLMALKSCGILKGRGQIIDHVSKFADAHVQPDKQSGSNGCHRPIWRLDLSLLLKSPSTMLGLFCHRHFIYIELHKYKSSIIFNRTPV
jgi:hypothetical protein